MVGGKGKIIKSDQKNPKNKPTAEISRSENFPGSDLFHLQQMVSRSSPAAPDTDYGQGFQDKKPNAHT